MTIRFFLSTVACILTLLNFAQTTTSEFDSLKTQLYNLQASVDSIKKQSEVPARNKAEAAAKIAKTKASILTQQIEAVRLCAKFIDRFAQGSAAINVILSGIQSGVTMGALSSPFVIPTFRKSYDNWLSRWGKFIPAVILPVASLAYNNNNAKIGSVSVGIGLTGLLSALSKSDKKRNEDITKAITSVTSTIDLFDFNRSVYEDIQKLKSVISSVHAADSTFNEQIQSYWKANQDVLTLSDDSISKDPRFLTFIDNTTIYFDRFQLKLTRVNYTLDYAQSLINSYKFRYNHVNSIDLANSQMLKETKKAIDDLDDVYTKFTSEWLQLQSNFYKITPTETRKFQLFYQLEQLKRTIE